MMGYDYFGYGQPSGEISVWCFSLSLSSCFLVSSKLYSYIHHIVSS
uniref:Uncharacterized protein n=1 Tax=Kalanchoe fedtschenkoi TaxID=63787 RepID=A0A7N1A3Z4_KALFE